MLIASVTLLLSVAKQGSIMAIQKGSAEHDLDCLELDGVQVDAGLESLEAALRSGFEQFNKVREDPNLDNLRKSEKFEKIINQYDEKVIDFT